MKKSSRLALAESYAEYRLMLRSPRLIDQAGSVGNQIIPGATVTGAHRAR